MTSSRWTLWAVAAGLLVAATAAAQDAAPLREAYWTELHRGSRAAQTCLADVMAEGATEVPCAEMHPAFARVLEVAEELEECCPTETSIEIDGTRFVLRNLARGHVSLADSVEVYRDRTDPEARTRRVSLAAQVWAWRTVVLRALEEFVGSSLAPGPAASSRADRLSPARDGPADNRLGATRHGTHPPPPTPRKRAAFR